MSVDLDLVKVAAARDACRNGVGRALRLSAGLSLREVADEIGAGDPSTVLRWERGQRRPRGEMAERYGDLLDRLASRGRSAPEMREAGFPASEPLADENVSGQPT